MPDYTDNPTFKAATAYAAAGLSVIPIRTDGTKALALASGQRQAFEVTIADAAQIKNWFGSGTRIPGVAILGGKVSGNLECIDFDAEADVTFVAWGELVEAEAPGLFSRLVVNSTPRGGYHAVYRVDAPVEGSLKLAAKPALDYENGRMTRETMIETRGEGGYFVAPGSPPATHQSGKPWAHHCGLKLSRVGTITAGERAILLNCARAFNRHATEQPLKGTPTAAGKLRPGDDFDARGPDWAELLKPQGWMLSHTQGDKRFWRRPGKKDGCSASTGVCVGKDGAELFHVFSSNAHPFEPNASYGKFAVYALLNHEGSYTAAARAAAEIGFGEQRKPAPPKPAPATVDPFTELGEQIRVQTQKLTPGDSKRTLAALAEIGALTSRGIVLAKESL